MPKFLASYHHQANPNCSEILHQLRKIKRCLGGLGIMVDKFFIHSLSILGAFMQTDE